MINSLGSTHHYDETNNIEVGNKSEEKGRKLEKYSKLVTFTNMARYDWLGGFYSSQQTNFIFMSYPPSNVSYVVQK